MSNQLKLPNAIRVANRRLAARLTAIFVMCMAPALIIGCGAAPPDQGRVYPSPEAAARALIDAAKRQSVDDLVAIFGPDSRDLVASSDAATARRNREVFTVAVAESWRLAEDGPNSRTLVIGNEAWPFPVPLVKDADGWRFDTAAGKEEIVDRRIGRNELAVIRVCRTYVTAQRLYAARGHDGKPAGRYARTFRSDTDRENGLYWPAKRGQKRSPLGDLVAQAAAEGRVLGAGDQPEPFHGYYFRILTSQGPAADGGAKDYVAGGEMTGGFALVAWPARYDATGVMTFLVSDTGLLYERDLGAETDKTARTMAHYNPDASWRRVN